MTTLQSALRVSLPLFAGVLVLLTSGAHGQTISVFDPGRYAGACPAGTGAAPTGDGTFSIEESGDAQIAFTVNSTTGSFDQTEITIGFPSASPVPSYTLSKGGVDCPSSSGGGTGCFAGKDVSFPISGPGKIIVLHTAPVTLSESWTLTVSGLDASAGVTAWGCISHRNSAAAYPPVTTPPQADLVSLHIQPTADAGPDQTRIETEPNIQLSGSGSANVAGKPVPSLTYAWTQTAGPAAPPAPPTGQTTTIATLPNVASSTPITYQLTVSDGTFGNIDDVVVTVEPRTPHEITLVLDHSESMNHEDKWVNAVKAADMFLELLSNLNDDFASEANEKDYYGLVSFTSAAPFWCEDSFGWGSRICGRYPALPEDMRAQAPIVIFDPVSPISVGSFTSGQSFWGTPIGDGLQKAIDGFESLDGASSGTSKPKMILLLTDGIENKGMLTINEFVANLGNSVLTPNEAVRATKIYTIGLGETDIQPDLISKIAADSGGDYRIANDPVVLPQFFAQILKAAIGAEEVMATEPNIYPLSGEQKAAFIVVWDPSVDTGPFFPHLQGAGELITPVNVNTKSFASVSVQLPNDAYTFYILRDAGAFDLDLNTGQWTFQISNSAGDVVTPASARKYVLVDLQIKTDFAFDRVQYFLGNDIELTADITHGGVPVTRDSVEVYAECDVPTRGIGTMFATAQLDWPALLKRYTGTFQLAAQPPQSSEARAPTGSEATGTARAAAAPVEPVVNIKGYLTRAVLEYFDLALLPKDTTRLRLYDDGVHNDGAADDGVYGNALQNVQKQGSISCVFTARDVAEDSPARFARTETKAVYVDVAPDPGDFIVDMVWLERLEQLEQVEMVLKPKTISGEYLGPFKKQVIAMRIENGRFAGELVDRYDGSYTQKLVYDPSGPTPVVTAAVHGKTVVDQAPIERPIWLWLLLTIIVAVIVGLALMFYLFRHVFGK